MAQAPPKRILLGRISTAHGIRGDVLVKSFTAAPEAIGAYGPLTDAGGKGSFRLTVVRVGSKGVICRVAGVSDRNAAEKLAGTDLWIDRARLPPPSADEYYHVDLIGLAAVTPDGAPLGEVVAVQNYGASDLLEIRLTASGKTELVPLTDAFVPSVEVEQGRVVVQLPEVAADDDDEPGEEAPGGEDA